MKPLLALLAFSLLPAVMVAQAPLSYAYGAYNVNQGVAPYLLNAGSGYVSHYHFVNGNSSGVWVQMFNAASASQVTAGTTPPLFQMYVPPQGSSSGGVLDGPFETPLYFPKGLVVAVTTLSSGSIGAAANIYVGVLLR